jgi:hypothetical protein
MLVLDHKMLGKLFFLPRVRTHRPSYRNYPENVGSQVLAQWLCDNQGEACSHAAAHSGEHVGHAVALPPSWVQALLRLGSSKQGTIWRYIEASKAFQFLYQVGFNQRNSVRL